MTLTVETASGFTIGSSPIILDRSSPNFQDWCFDSYHCCTAYHSEFSVCVILFLYVFNIFFCHCSVCLSVLFYGPRCLKLKLMVMMMISLTIVGMAQGNMQPNAAW